MVSAVVVLQLQPALAGDIPVALRGYSDMAVDEAHDSVYVASGRRSSAITVLTLDGAPKTLMEGLVGVREFETAHDGSRIYASIYDQRSIGLIDPATTTISKVVLGASVCPSSIAQAADTLWFTYNDCTPGGTFSIGAFRISDHAVTLGVRPVGYATALASSPGLPGRLVVVDNGQLSLFDVSGGMAVAPIQLRSTTIFGGDRAVITADGSEVVVGRTGYSTVDLSQNTLYGSGFGQIALGGRSDGLLAFYATDGIVLHQRGSPASWRAYNTMRMAGNTFGSRDLYTIQVRSAPLADEFFFQRITPRRLPLLRIATPAFHYSFGATTQATVHLGGGSTNRTVSLYAEPQSQARVLLARGPVDSSGNISAPFRLTRRTTFVATYGGDDDFDGTVVTRTVGVGALTTLRIPNALSISGQDRLVRVGAGPSVTVTVAPRSSTGCLRLDRRTLVAGTWTSRWTTGCTRLDASGRATFRTGSFPAGTRQRFRAVWSASPLSDQTTSAWTYVRFVR